MREIEPSQLVRADWLPRAVIAGFSAAGAMLLGFFLAYGLARAGARSGLPEPLPGWLYSLSHNSLTDLAGANLYAIAGAHFVVAIGLALVYARFAEPALPGPSWLRGAEFAINPWLLSIFV